jgi:hypothetical protein
MRKEERMMKPLNLFRVFVFVIPFLIVSLPAIPQWLGRTIATSILMFSFTVGVFWYGLSSRTKMILPSGKLSRPEYDSVRPTIERNIRVLVVLFGAFFFYYLTFPFSVDLARLVGGETPFRITGVVRNTSVPLFGLWFLEQSVRVFPETNVKYQLYYSWKPLRVGQTYEFAVLPRSRVIIQFRER